MNYWRAVWMLFAKDFREEVRRKENLAASFFFAFLALVLFYFSVDPTRVDLGQSGAGLLWLVILFAGNLFMGNTFRKETETGTLQALLLAPVDRSAIYLGKFLVNLAFLLMLEALILIFAFILLAMPVGEHLGWLAVVWFLVSIGYSAVGTLLSSLVAQIRGGHVLFPLLAFPVLIPLLIAASSLTQDVMIGQAARSVRWLQLVGLFDTIFLVAPLFLFEYAIEE